MIERLKRWIRRHRRPPFSAAEIVVLAGYLRWAGVPEDEARKVLGIEGGSNE